MPDGSPICWTTRRAVVDTGSPAGRLVIGVLETTTLRLAPVLANFVIAHEWVDLSLRAGTTEELIHRVRTRELEGAFVCGRCAIPTSRRRRRLPRNSPC